MPNICEVILKLSISRHKSNDRFFSKNSHSELDLKPSTLAEAVLSSTHILCFEQKYEKYLNFLSENFQFFGD